MSNNLTLNTNTTSGQVLATDDVSGIHYQRVKLVDGTEDATGGIPGSATDGLLVNLGSNNDVTVTGTVTVTQTTASSLNAEVQGDAAHDAAVSGNPVLVGAYAKATAPTDVSTDGDAVRIWADLAGRVQVGDGGQTLSVDDGSGSITVDGTVTVTQSTASSLNAQAVGNVAHDGVASGNPVQIAGYGSSSPPTSVSTNGDVTRIWTDLRGAVHVNLVADDAGSVTDTLTSTVRVNGVTGSFSGAIQDGGNSSIQASVFDYDNSNPLAVRLTDVNGDYVAAGGGTQYTEDAVAAANPVGTQIVARRRDTPGPEVSADGDVIALNATNNGELYVKHAEPIRAIVHDGNSQAKVSDLYSGGALNVAVVDADGLQITSFGGGTQYTEDAASASDPIGNQLLARRRDSLSTETSADGDVTALNSTGKGELYVKHTDTIPVTDNGGSLTIDNSALSVVGGGVESTALRVTIASDSTGVLSVDDNGGSLTIDDGSGSITVDNGGTFAVQATVAASAANIAKAEDVASADADVGVPAMAVRKATPANTSGTDGDYEMLQMSAGRLWTSSTIDAALPAGANAIGKLAANDGVDIGDVTINNASGASAVNIQDGGNSITVDGSVTVTQSTASSLNAQVVGPDAHDAAVSGNPVTVAGRASSAAPTAVSADGDVTRLWVDRRGAARVALVDDSGDSVMDGTNNAVNVNVVAGGAGNGAILDGVDSAIKASVLDYVNSNPLAVRLTDTNGDYVGAGGGTQYTEDAASSADPIGTQLIARRRDALTVETSTDGDVTALNSTKYGELYVKHAEPVRAIIHDGNSQAVVSDLYNGGALNVAVVDADGLQITSFGGGTQYTEDAASVANPVGNQIIARRRDTLAGETSADGDAVAVNSTDKGELYVKHVDAIPVTDNGGSLTVDGTVAATQSGTWNIGTVTTVTNVVHVDDNASSLTVDNAGTFAVQAAQSGTWTVQPGNTANTTAWKVDGSSVTQPVSGTVTASIAAGATTIAKAEDVASADADVGVPAMAIRKASPANTSGTDGDYEMLQMSAGRLWTSATIDAALPAGTNVIGHAIIDSGSTTAVTQATGTNLHMVVDSGTVSTITNVVHVDDNSSSLTVDNAGTFAVQATIAAAATNIAKAEDVASADADVGVPAMAVRKATPANTSGTDGDYEMLQMSAGRLWTSTTVDAALPAGANAIGKLAANDGVDIGDVTINNASGGSAVNVQDGGNSLTVDNAGTFAVQSTTATSSGNTTMQNAASATGNGSSLTVTGYGTALCSITGTFTATVTFEGSTDAGTTWDAVSATQVGTSVIATTATATGQYRLNVAGLDLLRARVTWTSGTSVTVIGRATNAINSNKVVAISTASIAKAEDVASADADIGVPAMAVRKATPANTSGTDGDYEMLQMSAGRLWTSSTIDAALPAGTNAIGKLASNSGVTIGAIEIASSQTLATVTNVATIGTSVTPGTSAAHLGKAEDAAHADGDTGVMALAVRKNTAASTSGTDGDYQPLITNTTGHLWVDASGQTLTVGSHAVTNAGTFAVQVDGSALTSLQLIDNSSVDHDAVAVAGVTQQGATARTTDITAVSSGDAVRVTADTLGKQVVLVGAVNDLQVSGKANYTDTTAADLIAAAGAGVRIAIMSVLVTNAHATTSTVVEIRDGTTVKLQGYAVAAGGGFALNGGGTPLFISTANTAITGRCATTGATVDVFVSGYKYTP